MTKKKLKPLDQHNAEIMEKTKIERLRLTGLACPKCGEELQDSDGSMLLCSPAKKRVNCTKCDHTGYRYA